MSDNPHCSICTRLKDAEASFRKYLAPDLDQPLPEAAGELVVVGLMEEVDAAKRHVRRCPLCGTLYDYLSWHEYVINGTEDHEELRRMGSVQAAAFLRAQVLRLEGRRREIEALESGAGGLGDYIDRGRPSAADEQEAYESMQAQRQDAAVRRRRLQAQVEELRSTCPGILAAWADAHARVCRFFLASLPDQDEDDRTARFVAGETLAAWERLPRDGEAFIPIPSAWLDGYWKRLEQELAPPVKN